MSHARGKWMSHINIPKLKKQENFRLSFCKENFFRILTDAKIPRGSLNQRLCNCCVHSSVANTLILSASLEQKESRAIGFLGESFSYTLKLAIPPSNIPTSGSSTGRLFNGNMPSNLNRLQQRRWALKKITIHCSFCNIAF